MNVLLVLLFFTHIIIVLLAATDLFSKIKKLILTADIVICLVMLYILLFNLNIEAFLLGLLIIILSYIAPSPAPGLLESLYRWSIKNILFRKK